VVVVMMMMVVLVPVYPLRDRKNKNGSFVIIMNDTIPGMMMISFWWIHDIILAIRWIVDIDSVSLFVIVVSKYCIDVVSDYTMVVVVIVVELSSKNVVMVCPVLAVLDRVVSSLHSVYYIVTSYPIS
jgi:hypothetical protein